MKSEFFFRKAHLVTKLLALIFEFFAILLRLIIVTIFRDMLYLRLSRAFSNSRRGLKSRLMSSPYHRRLAELLSAKKGANKNRLRRRRTRAHLSSASFFSRPIFLMAFYTGYPLGQFKRTGSASRSNRLTSYMPFLTEIYLFRIPSPQKWNPFHKATNRRFIPFSSHFYIRNLRMF